MEPRNYEQRSLVDQWMAALKDADWNTRATAVRMLGDFGELTPLEPLLTALSDEDESVRAAAVRALGKLGERAPVDRLVVALTDSSWMVREMAALTIGELGERVPAQPLVDIVRTEHEDVFVREAARIALEQAHPEVLPALAQQTTGYNHAEDHHTVRANQHYTSKSSPLWLVGLAKRFSRRRSSMQEEQDFVEITDLPAAANSNPPLPLPVSIPSNPHLSLRIAEGLLVALLILGLGFSWLLLTRKLHPSSLGKPTPTPVPTVLPSGPGHNVNLAVVNGVVDVGTMDSAVYALRASDGSLLWRYQTAGPVDNPVVVNGVVYVNANVDGLLGYVTGYIYALRASDGSLLWRYTPGNSVFMGYVYSPTVANGVVYVASQAGSMAALRASDGKLLWRYTAKGQVAVSMVANGIVYLIDTNIDQSPDYLEALRASDGKLLWRTPGYDYLPVVVNNIVYITSQAGLSALRASDGALLWRYTLAGTSFAGQMLLDGVIYAIAFKTPPPTSTTLTAGYARVAATSPINWKIPFKEGAPSSLYALQASNGRVLWHYQTPGDKNEGMGVLALSGGLVYIDTTIDQNKNIISALRASDGSLLWSHADDAPFNQVVPGQGAIYIVSSSGISNSSVVYALQAQNGKELWRCPIPADVNSSPVLDGSTLYIGADNGVIYALDASTGSLLWHYITWLSTSCPFALPIPAQATMPHTPLVVIVRASGVWKGRVGPWDAIWGIVWPFRCF